MQRSYGRYARRFVGCFRRGASRRTLQAVVAQWPVLATILQMQWGRLPLEGKPLGRIRASRSRLAAKGRAARTQYKPKAARRGAAAAAPDATAASALMGLAAYSDDDEGGAESGGGDGGASCAAARSIATPWRAPPSTAYELFARVEAARRLGVPGRTDRLGVADWEAITRAWHALSDEQRRHQQASFEAAASIGLAQGARGSCAYLCHRGRAEELLACNDCGSSVRCGHAACFAGRCEELDVNPSDAFLCPTCLQAYAIVSPFASSAVSLASARLQGMPSHRARARGWRASSA